MNGLLFKIAQHKESRKWTQYLLLVIPEKFESNILTMYHNSLLAMHQGLYRTFLTMRKQFYFPNMLPKIQKYIEACTLCQRTKPKNTKQRPYYGRITIEYIPCENLVVDLKKMPMGILYHEFLLIATCEKTNFVHAIPKQNRQMETIANALLHHVCCLNRPTNKTVYRPGFSSNIYSHKRNADQPGMYNTNNKPMESRKLKSRTTDSNNWKHDK